MLGCLWPLSLVFPTRREPSEVAPLDHMGCHIQRSQREADKRGQLVAPFTHLSEALEVKDEYVGKCPQTHLNHALLELLAVRTFPCVVRSQLGKQGIMWYKVSTLKERIVGIC